MTMLVRSKALFVPLCIWLLVSLAKTSHFRGGTYSCEPVLDSTTNGGITSTGLYKVGTKWRSDGSAVVDTCETYSAAAAMRFLASATAQKNFKAFKLSFPFPSVLIPK